MSDHLTPSTSHQKKAIVAGAGPVGCLTALSLAKKGWIVELWEGRPDPKSDEAKKEMTRSVNLAISSRGLGAILAIEPTLADEFAKLSLPMKGRMIWDFENNQNSQLYDPLHQTPINSISRPLLSSTILSHAQSHPNITVLFDHKVAKIDWKRRIVYRTASGFKGGWEDPSEGQNEGAGKGWDLMVGSDGIWSAVRGEMMKVSPSIYSQNQIPHVWIELHLPPGPVDPSTGEATFFISPEHLHIWPRKEFMLIALPNKDRSFTMTLYAPSESIAALSTRDLARKFFRTNFSPPSSAAPDSPQSLDILSLMGEDQVLDDFESARRGGLTIVSVEPVSYGSGGGVLLGDAGHSMVPFYGQGLNCGLEDVRVLDSFLAKHGITGTAGSRDELAAALNEYSSARKEDLKAILQLAYDNYDEMKSKVLSPLHLLRRKLDSLLSSLFPPPTASQITSSLVFAPPGTPFPAGRVSRWSSLYHMTAFRADVGYAEAMRREKWQKSLVEGILWGLGGVGVVGVAAVGVMGWMGKGRSVWERLR